MRQLDRIAQRNLQYPDAEFDALGRRRECSQGGERIQRSAAAAK